MATSTVPTLKANLITQLAARPALTGVQVSYGPPLPSPRREYIWVGDVTGTQEFGTMAAPNQRHETYDVQLTIGVLKEGTDSQGSDERCFVIFGEIETQVRGDVTVNGAVAVAKVGTFVLSEFVSPDGMNRTAQLVTNLNCQAWI